MRANEAADTMQAFLKKDLHNLHAEIESSILRAVGEMIKPRRC